MRNRECREGQRESPSINRAKVMVESWKLATISIWAERLDKEVALQLIVNTFTWGDFWEAAAELNQLSAERGMASRVANHLSSFLSSQFSSVHFSLSVQWSSVQFSQRSVLTSHFSSYFTVQFSSVLTSRSKFSSVHFFLSVQCSLQFSSHTIKFLLLCSVHWSLQLTSH